MGAKNKNSNGDMIIYVFLGALLTAAWHFATGTAYNSGEARFPVNFNLFLYVASVLGVCVLAAVCFLLFDFICSRIGEAGGVSRFFNVVLIPAFILAAAGLVFLIYTVYNNENTLYPGGGGGYSLRQYFPHPLYFAFMFVPAVLVFAGLGGKENIKKSRLIRAAVSLAISLLSAVYTWCPNPYADKGGGILHIDAYTTSIINTARLVPFDAHHISIYGHHGILYLPIVRLFGGNYRALLLAIAIFTFITFMAACYAASALIRRDSVYMLTAAVICATTTLLTRRGVYYQINPHRIMFPMICLAFLAWEAQHPKEKFSIPRMIVKILISLAAFVWNFETGLFTAIMLSFSMFMELHYDSSWFTLKTLRTVILLAVYIGGTFFAAVGIVDLYNSAAGGDPVTLRQFVYPLFSGNYSVSNLRKTMPSVGHLFFLQILLFGFTILSILRNRKETPEKDRGFNILAAAAGLSGFSSLIYFVNRPAYGNMSIAFIQMAILLGRGTDLFIDRKKLFAEGIKAHKVFKYMLGMIMFFLLYWISIEGILYIEPGMGIRKSSGWNSAEVKEVLEEIREEIPKDTFAIGKGVPQLYYELGWDPQIYPIDSPDMNDENRRYIKERIKDEEAVLSQRGDLIPEDFELKSKYKIGTVEFGYYVKNSEKSPDSHPSGKPAS